MTTRPPFRPRHLRLVLLVPAVAAVAGCAPAPTKVDLQDAGRFDAQPAGDVASKVVCRPSAGPVIWVEETDPVKAQIRCETGAAGSFRLSDLPPGAAFDADAATFTWTPGLDQAAVYELRIEDIRSHEVGTLKIGVADKFHDPDNQPIAEPSKYTEEFGLPVMHLTTSAAFEAKLTELRAYQTALAGNSCQQPCPPNDGFYAPVEIVYRGKRFSMPEGHYRGASSLNYPKRNITLRFSKDDKFTEPLLANGHMTKRRRVALITTHDDNSYVRWRLSFELWNRMDPKNIPLEHLSVVLFLNGAYHGLYTLSDKIDDNMMVRAGLGEATNIYMGVDHSAQFETFQFVPLPRPPGTMQMFMAGPKQCVTVGFVKKDGDPPACVDGTFAAEPAMDDLAALVDFVAASDDTTFNAGVEKTLDVRDYGNWFIHTTAIAATDTFAKNGIHVHAPASPNSPWRTTIWDFNASFGQSFNTTRVTPAQIDPRIFEMEGGNARTNKLWRRILAHPTLGPALRARYGALLRGAWKLENVLALYDTFEKETAAAARRDEKKWRSEYVRSYSTVGPMRNDLTTRDEEIEYTRQWIVDRWQYLLGIYPG